MIPTSAFGPLDQTNELDSRRRHRHARASSTSSTRKATTEAEVKNE